MPKPPADIASRGDINISKWGKRFDPKNEEDLNEETVNGYILYCMDYYKGKYDDIALWEYFREDFEGWTKDTFALGNSNLVREFQDWLRIYGCYVRRDGKSVASALQETLEEEEQHEWTEKEIEYQLKSLKKFYSQWNPNNSILQATPKPTLQPSQTPS